VGGRGYVGGFCGGDDRERDAFVVGDCARERGVVGGGLGWPV
jgi:hypothetical protein